MKEPNDEPDEELIGQCDCCGAEDVPLTRLVAFGIDTAACEKCRNP